jgi:hypothetical protein
MFFAPFHCIRLDEGAHSTRQEVEEEREQTEIAIPYIEKAREMREDHTPASFGACPCHQLSAHESRIEVYIL